MARRQLKRRQARQKIGEQKELIDNTEFALNWIDSQIGQGEYRHAVIIYSKTVLLDLSCIPADDIFECAMQDFRMRTSQISISTDAHFLRFESCAAILGWLSLNWNGVASAAFQLAAWRHTLLGASCVISVGRVLVSEHQKHWSDHETLLSGALFAPLGAVQTQLAAGKVDASRTFTALCASFDTGKTESFCCKRSLDGTPDFLELHPIANSSEAHMILRASPLPLSVADKRRELLAEERFFALGRFRRVLSVAAVIGRVFDCGLLAQCLSMDIAHLTSIIQHLACMSALEREGACPSSHQTFRFIDDTLHDAAYRALPLQSRTWLHSQVANCLVRQRDDQNTNAELSAAIAWHFAKSGKALEAGTWCHAAAMDAVVSSTPDLAIAYLQQAYQSLEGARSKNDDFRAGWIMPAARHAIGHCSWKCLTKSSCDLSAWIAVRQS